MADAPATPAQALGLGTTSAQIDEARQAGYSDQDIFNYISNQSPKLGEAVKEGYSASEVLNHLYPDVAPPSGYWDQMKEGIADVASGIGKTADVNSTPGGTVNNIGKALENWGAQTAPQDFRSADLTGPKGKMSNLGLWLARQVPAAGTVIGGALAAGYIAPESALAASIGAMVPGVAMTAGNEEQTAADNRTGVKNSPVATPDVVRGLGTSVAENAVNAIPVGRYLTRLAGPLEQTGMAGVTNAAKGLVKTAALQGAAGAGSDVVHQLGQSVGTPQGASINPAEVVEQGIGSAAMGGLLGAKGATREALDSAKFSAITPELRPYAGQVANRLIQNTPGGADALIPGMFQARSAQRAGETAMQKTGLDINNELDSAVDDLKSRVALPTEAANVLKSIQDGQRPTPEGYATLQNAIASDPQADNVMNLAKQKHVFDIVNSTGNHIADNTRFAGGLASKFRQLLSPEHLYKTGLVAALGAGEGGAGHMIAFSPHVMAAAAGGALAARALDNITKAQAPAGRFVRNFGNPEAGVRLVVPQAAQEPEKPIDRGSPTGPKIKPEPSPWAGGREPFQPRPVAGGSIITPGVRAAMDARAALGKLRTAPAEEAPAINPAVLPTSITGPAKNIMRGAAIAARMRDMTIGQDVANAEIANSPLIAQKLNGQEMPTPQAAKFMRQGIGSASTLAKIQSDPEAIAEAKAEAAIAKLAAKKGAQAPAKEQDAGTQITTVRKSNGTTGVNDEEFAPSNFAHLSPEQAADAITKEEKAKGNVTYPRGYKRSTQARITGERVLMQKLYDMAPDLPIADITARFEGRRTPSAAREYRDRLKVMYPNAAAAIDNVLTDDAINGLWRRK